MTVLSRIFNYLNAVFGVFLGIGILLSATGYHQAQASDLVLTPEEKAWIAQHPEVQLGVDYNWPPYEFVDEEGHLHGISSDLLKLFERKLGQWGLKFQLKPDVWAQTLQKAKAGQLMGLSAAVETPERKQTLNFTSPYLSFPLAIYVQESNQQIQTFSDLKGKTVALNQGSYLQEWLEQHHPDIQLKLTNSNQAAIEALVYGQTDAYIGNIHIKIISLICFNSFRYIN